jgi:hypothetical protein
MHFDLKIAAIAFLAVAALTPNAVWADDLPPTAGDFAAYCTPLKDACDGKITEVQVAAMIRAMTSTPPVTACQVPKGIERVAGEKAIIGWLSKHSEAAGMSTADGINAAIKALWNCRASIATGVTSLGVPDMTGAFVKYCAVSRNYVRCANQIVEASTNAAAEQTFNGSSQHCQVPNGVNTHDSTAKVLAWLKKHKETYGQSTDGGIASAVDNLWPCH